VDDRPSKIVSIDNPSDLANLLKMFHTGSDVETVRVQIKELARSSRYEGNPKIDLKESMEIYIL
jgi:hypothetical protein